MRIAFVGYAWVYQGRANITESYEMVLVTGRLLYYVDYGNHAKFQETPAYEPHAWNFFDSLTKGPAETLVRTPR